MRIKPVSEKPNLGKMVVIYSETGVGKSTSCFQSLPVPIMYMCGEMRNAELSAEACGRKLIRGDIEKPRDYVLAEYTTWDAFLEFINMTETFQPFASVVMDGVTQLMVNLSFEIGDEAFFARNPEKQKDKPLIQRPKLTEEGYGSLAAQMSRAIIPLGRLSQQGKFVVLNALLEGGTKWDSSIGATPAFMGKKFGSEYPGAVDLIGLVVRRYDDDKKLVFPPLVKFESSESETFECKWTGPRLQAKDNTGKPITDAIMQMPLDFNVILRR